MNVYIGLAILGVAVAGAAYYYWRNKAKVDAEAAAAKSTVQSLATKINIGPKE